MDSAQKTSQNLFEVYLRLRPPLPGTPSQPDRVLNVEKPEDEAAAPSHITLNPPSDRRRAVERFGFTRVFEEEASQVDVFNNIQIVPMVEGVLGSKGGEGTDAVVATLGVTGSGKTHTILGSKTQRGLAQLALDLVVRSIGDNMLDANTLGPMLESIQACDPSEAALTAAPQYLETVYADHSQFSRANSRAATPMIVRSPVSKQQHHEHHLQEATLPCSFPDSIIPSPASDKDDSWYHLPKKQYRCSQRPMESSRTFATPLALLSAVPKRASHRTYMSLTTAARVTHFAKQSLQGEYSVMSPGPRRNLPMPSSLPQHPKIDDVNVPCDPNAEYVIVVSMYEVHNDRIYDLLTPATKNAATKEFRRRPLLFKSTELSPDRKVVAGLRKVVCTNFKDAILVLEAGLQERRVTGTGSNSVSSRSHGFFCFDVKKRTGGRRPGPWGGSKLTIVDLAGSERARDAKTQGATLVEAGKINESLMYLGQCLQTQSESGNSAKPNVVPYRQCKLTELLFSNSFPSSSSSTHPNAPRRNPQRGVMIVTADPIGDFNATSQILRYSALAREVTVPRIPSITATILANPPQTANNQRPASPVHNNNNNNNNSNRPFVVPSTNGGYRNHTPPMNVDERATMEMAALEIARLSDEVDQLRAEVDYESDARVTAEAHLLSMEDRLLELESAIREECAAEFEQRFILELARFKTSLALEQERNEEHWDRKVDLLERGLDSAADEMDIDKENVLVEDMTQEVERLRRENAVLKRELAGRSPTKRKPLEEREDFLSSTTSHDGVTNLGKKLEKMKVQGESSRSSSSNGSPKKTRKAAAKA